MIVLLHTSAFNSKNPRFEMGKAWRIQTEQKIKGRGERSPPKIRDRGKEERKNSLSYVTNISQEGEGS